MDAHLSLTERIKIKEKTQGRFVVPTEAYKDEGISYHYMPPSDYIEIKNHEKLASICDFYGFDFYDFLVTGDVLLEDEYEMEKLNDANHNLNKFRLTGFMHYILYCGMI